VKEDVLSTGAQAELSKVILQEVEARGNSTELEHPLVSLIHSNEVDPYISDLVVSSAVNSLHGWVVEHHIGRMGLAESERILVDLVEKPSIAVHLHGALESETFVSAKPVWLTWIGLLSYVSPAATDFLY
jgi:hypothetical protein